MDSFKNDLFKQTYALVQKDKTNKQRIGITGSLSCVAMCLWLSRNNLSLTNLVLSLALAAAVYAFFVGLRHQFHLAVGILVLIILFASMGSSEPFGGDVSCSLKVALASIAGAGIAYRIRYRIMDGIWLGASFMFVVEHFLCHHHSVAHTLAFHVSAATFLFLLAWMAKLRWKLL